MFFDKLIDSQDIASKPPSSALPTSSFLSLNRRQFIASSGLFTVGVLLGEVRADSNKAENNKNDLSKLEEGDATPSLFISIDEAGNINARDA